MNDSSQRIADLIAQGKKLEAIKELREMTGIGLKKAKEEIERLIAEREGREPTATTQQPVSGHGPEPGHEEVAALARAGRKVEAIKLLRSQTGLGLKEAKEAVEKMRGGRESGCLSVLLLLIVALAGLFMQ